MKIFHTIFTVIFGTLIIFVVFVFISANAAVTVQGLYPQYMKINSDGSTTLPAVIQGNPNINNAYYTWGLAVVNQLQLNSQDMASVIAALDSAMGITPLHVDVCTTANMKILPGIPTCDQVDKPQVTVVSDPVVNNCIVTSGCGSNCTIGGTKTFATSDDAYAAMIVDQASCMNTNCQVGSCCPNTHCYPNGPYTECGADYVWILTLNNGCGQSFIKYYYSAVSNTQLAQDNGTKQNVPATQTQMKTAVSTLLSTSYTSAQVQQMMSDAMKEANEALPLAANTDPGDYINLGPNSISLYGPGTNVGAQVANVLNTAINNPTNSGVASNVQQQANNAAGSNTTGVTPNSGTLYVNGNGGVIGGSGTFLNTPGGNSSGSNTPGSNTPGSNTTFSPLNSYAAPTAPGTFGTPTVNDFSGLFTTFVNDMKSTSFFSLPGLLTSSIPSGGDCSWSVDMGSRFGGEHNFSICNWSTGLSAVKAVLLCIASIGAIGIISKGGGA